MLLPDWLKKLWHAQLFLFNCFLVGAIAGLFIFFNIPNEYETTVFCGTELTRYEIEAEESPLATLGMIEPSKVLMRDGIRPSLYPQVVSSVPFLVSLFDIPVANITQSTKNGNLTLFEYMDEHQQYPWWNTILSFPYKVVGFATSLFQKDENTGDTIQSKDIDIFRLTRRQSAVIGSIRKRISVETDIRRRTVVITVRMQDPLVSAIVADTITSRIRAYITDYRQKKEFNTVEYIEKIHEEVRQRYHSSQETYAHFADRNRDLASKVAQSELQKLKVEMNLTYTDYMRLSSQLQAAKGRAAKVRPVYTVIEPAKVPLKPVAPSPVKIVCVCVLLALLMGSGWIWVKSYINKFR